MMRVPEKTIEINFCSQLSLALGRRVFWFGLTQRQEAQAGVDVWTKMSSGRLFVLQFKASNRIVNDRLLGAPARQFKTAQHQINGLMDNCNGRPGIYFYALPAFGNTLELNQLKRDIIANTWLLDVASISRNKYVTPASSGSDHKIHLDGKRGLAMFYSEPTEMRLNSGKSLGEMPGVTYEQFADIAGGGDIFPKLFRPETRKCVAVIVE